MRRQRERIFRNKLYRKILEKFVVFIVNIASLHPCAVAVGIMLHDLESTLMQKSVDMVVIGRFFVYRELIYSVGCFQFSVREAIRQIKSGQSLHLRRLFYCLGGIIWIPAEKFHFLGVGAKSDNVAADLVCNESFIAACAHFYARHTVPVHKLRCVFHFDQNLSFN